MKKYTSFIFILVLSYLFYTLLYNQHYNGYPSDHNSHVDRILPIINGQYFLPHPLWHYVVYSLNKFTGVFIKTDLQISSIIVSLIMMILSIGISHYVIQKETKETKIHTQTIFLAILVTFITPIYLSTFNRNLYLGQWSPNLWHSPTIFMLKPIMIVCFYYFIKWLNENKLNFKNNKTYMVGLPLLFAISALAKPSFAFSFIPALLLFCIIKFKTIKSDLYQIFFLIVPLLLVIVIQYFLTYQSNNANAQDLKNEIIFSFYGVNRLYTPNVFISLILAIAFPLTVLFTYRKDAFKNNYILLAVLNSIVAYVQVSILAEKKYFEMAAFAFGYCLSLYLLFLFTIILFVKKTNFEFKSMNFGERLAAILLIFHFISGIHYFSKIYLGNFYS